MFQEENHQTRERLRRLLKEEYPREWLRDLLGQHAVRAGRTPEGPRGRARQGGVEASA